MHTGHICMQEQRQRWQWQYTHHAQRLLVPEQLLAVLIDTLQMMQMMMTQRDSCSRGSSMPACCAHFAFKAGTHGPQRPHATHPDVLVINGMLRGAQRQLQDHLPLGRQLLPHDILAAAVHDAAVNRNGAGEQTEIGEGRVGRLAQEQAASIVHTTRTPPHASVCRL